MSTTVPHNSQAQPKKVVLVKNINERIVLQRRDEILTQINYVEVQIGRLAKMARDLRAMVTHILVE